MRDLWSQKLNWDDCMGGESQGVWLGLSKDLAKLGELSFPRRAVDSENPFDMYLFTDASPKAYGFVAYGVQNQKSCILYSKAKVAPMKKKSLPTLELLGVFLALKSLSFLLKAYSNVQNVYISIDAK